MIRYTVIDVWRTFFCRYGMGEIELSGESLNEAKLLIKNCNCGNCCIHSRQWSMFLVSWNGVPIFSVSA
ncbi:putative transcription factor GRAS family [Helianthus anomalus]